MGVSNQELIKQLEDKLYWFIYEASVDEYDVDEVITICELLDKLKPFEEEFQTPKEAYRKFKKLYDTESSQKRVSRSKYIKFTSKVAIILVVFIVAISVNVATYATENKSFIEIVFDSLQEIKIKTNGETPQMQYESKTEKIYDSWADLENEIKSKILIPEYLPKEMRLFNLETQDLDTLNKVMARYTGQSNEYLNFVIDIFKNEKITENQKLDNSWEKNNEISNNEVVYYQSEDVYMACFSKNNCYYSVSGNIELEEFQKVIKNMK